MKATATDLARDTARLISHAESGRTVVIEKHGTPRVTLSSVRTTTGERLARGLEKLSKADRLALKAAIADGMKAVRD